MSDAFRIYAPEECGTDGYPLAWYELAEPEHSELLNRADMVLPGGIKDVVRALAGHRCVRCRHPYWVGRVTCPKGEWSPCDTECTHTGPLRHQLTDESWVFHPHAETTPYLFARNRIPVETRWRILTVHHLNGVKADCRWWNLAALCQRCHLQIQGKVQMARVWPWEHTPWFRPYVAGYYASVYLGEELTRAEVEARLDDLLALERAA